MTIKTKLTLNVVFLILIVTGVAVTSVVGMGFVKSRLQDLTQRSTPFQMRTVEFQRAIQGATADMIKVGAVRSQGEYKAFREEMDKSLLEVRERQDALKALGGDAAIEAYAELNGIATELVGVTEGRLKADEDALAAGRNIAARLKEASGRLKELDSKIKGLQAATSGSYTRSVSDTTVVSARVRSIEALKLALKDFQLGFLEVQKAQSKKGVLIAQGKCNSSITRSLQNDLLKSSPAIAADVKALSVKAPEYIKLQGSVVGQPGADTAARDTLAAEIAERLNNLLLAVEQEGTIASDRFSNETARQSAFFGNSNLATTVLGSNSELLSLGLNVEGLATRLFTAANARELDGIEAELRRTFARIATVRGELNNALGRLNARKEATLLRGAEGALSSINGMLFVKDGVIATIRNRQEMETKAAAATARLREIVLKQAEKGKKTVSLAQGDQEKAITTVNRMVRISTTLIIAIGLAAVTFGVAFGVWVYRSISRPLAASIAVVDRVADGQLNVAIETGRSDEIGRLMGAIGRMTDNLRTIIGEVRVASEAVSSSSGQLLVTAEQMAVGAEQVASQAGTVATASEEMASTSGEIARNCLSAARGSREANRSVEDGTDVVRRTIGGMESIAAMVRSSAVTVERLGRQSEQIGEITGTIEEIADQTNLLALNAAIEAARAGEHGHGFAVVADEVRTLAERATAATREIGTMIKSIQQETRNAVAAMVEGVASVEEGSQDAARSGEALQKILEHIGDVTVQVDQIATAAEQQTATTGEITGNIMQITGVVQATSRGAQESATAAGKLSALAAELQRLVGRFTLA